MMNKILIVDIETTGFIGKGSIVEIGIASLNLDSGGVKILFDSVCREDMFNKSHYKHPMGWIFKNSNLTVEKVLDAPKFNIIKKEVQDIINEYTLGITAFNNMFDFKFLENRGFTLKNKLPCPMKLATNICKIQKNNSNGYKWPNVEEAWKHFIPDIQYNELHRGADDARHEAYIVYELYKLGIFKV